MLGLGQAGILAESLTNCVATMGLRLIRFSFLTWKMEPASYHLSCVAVAGLHWVGCLQHERQKKGQGGRQMCRHMPWRMGPAGGDRKQVQPFWMGMGVWESEG